jgi:hypothetical protein
MNPKELKTALKPIVKELIYECLITEGILASVVSEVTKGMGNKIVESTTKTQAKPTVQQRRVETDDEAMARRKKLEEVLVGRLGVNVFEGTTPLNKGGSITERASGAKAPDGADPLSGTDPSDPGVDITGLLRMTGGWKQI